jgi:group II intron reverse transcriptase/maturase
MERNNNKDFTRKKLTEELRYLEALSPSRAKLNKLWVLNQENPEKINDNLIKLTADIDMIWNAYQKIKKNKGSMTQGTRMETADDFNNDTAKEIGNDIKNGYKWSEIRRKNIPKPGKKEKRPLGIPNFYDRIVQENIRLILNTIYEPLFQKTDANHGFRPNRSTESAIERVHSQSQGMTTAIEGDFRKAYDNIRKKKLLEILRKKISDNKFLNLIETSFEADIIDEKQRKISSNGIGVPQGSLASPILFNIVLHEFDIEITKIVERILNEKNQKEGRMEKTTSKNYEKVRIKINNLKRSMKNNKCKITNKYKEFEKHKTQKKELRKLLTEKRNTEPMAKVKQKLSFSYTRYADDWIILTNAEKNTCETIKKEITQWTIEKIKLELHQEKTLITDLNKEQTKFLGFTLYKTKQKIVTFERKNQEIKRRLNVGLAVGIDIQRVLKRLKEKRIINDSNKPIHSTTYRLLETWQIVEVYTQMIRGLVNYYYHSITNKSALNYVYYLIKYSCLKTLANKKKSSIKSVITNYGSKLKIKYNSYKWNVNDNKEERIEKEVEFPSYIELMDWAGEISRNKTNERIKHKREIKKLITKKNETTSIIKKSHIKENNIEDIIQEKKVEQYNEIKFNLRSGYQARKWCVICYEPNGIYNPIQTHHIRSLKTGNIEGIDNIMKALNRKTIPCCRNCHRKIHNKEYNGPALNKIMDRVLATI